jgi:hypothetical protein
LAGVEDGLGWVRLVVVVVVFVSLRDLVGFSLSGVCVLSFRCRCSLVFAEDGWCFFLFFSPFGVGRSKGRGVMPERKLQAQVGGFMGWLSCWLSSDGVWHLDGEMWCQKLRSEQAVSWDGSLLASSDGFRHLIFSSLLKRSHLRR